MTRGSADLFPPEPRPEPIPFRCERCRGEAHHGVGRTLRSPGRWWCAACLPEEYKVRRTGEKA